MAKRDVRVVLIVATVVALLLTVAWFAPDPEPSGGGEEPTRVERVEREEPNSDYERCIADDECLNDLLEFTERNGPEDAGK